jgi:phage tail-like protein
MNSVGVTPESLIQKWQWAVEINGFRAGLFIKVKWPDHESEVVEFNPGGSMHAQKAAGRSKYGNIELERGIPQENPDTSLRDWRRQVVTVNAGVGGVPGDYMRDVDLVEYARDGKEVRRVRVYGAFPEKMEYGEGDGGSSDNKIETMTLCCQYWDDV